MARLILFNKPFQVLSQFTDPHGRRTLADYLQDKEINVAGRLDYDSEGLLLLTENGLLQQQISNPRYKTWKTYWVQVDGIPNEDQLQQLRGGVALNDGRTLPARVETMPAPQGLWPRQPPIRLRKNLPTSWLQIQIREGRNRQVRRMTAAIGHPTLRLVRQSIGSWRLDSLQPGQWRAEQINMPKNPAVRRGTRSV